MTSYPIRTRNGTLRQGLRRVLRRRYPFWACHWLKLGYAVVPATRSGKNPAVQFGRWASGKEFEPRERFNRESLIELSDRFPACTRWLLLLDSNPDRRLVGVDVDDPLWWPWIIDTFGDTDLKVYSGRDVPDGSERPGHAYYRAPQGVYVPGRNGHIGPAEAFRWPSWPDEDDRPPKLWGTSPIDVKSGANYLVGPGSIHRSGREYECTVEKPTKELLDSLPVFDVQAYEEMCSKTKAIRRRLRQEHLNLPTVPPTARRTIVQHLAGEIDADTVVTLVSGVSAPLHEIGSRLSPGGQTKIVYCPEHRNTDTPAASVGVSAGGRVFMRCFGSCDTTFWMLSSHALGLVLGSVEGVRTWTPQEVLP